MTALRLADVACVRGGRRLFDGVTLALAAGDAALVTGLNGVGKSSLVRIAAGLLRPAAGGVTRDGAVALLGEASPLDAERRLADALAVWLPRGAVAAAIQAVGLAPLAQAPVRVLSTGQRKRAGLALVAGAGVPIWLLDEPANGLDAEGVAMLERLIARHRAGGGIALVATHLAVALPHATALALG